jgi:hypothetical protein
MSPLPGKIQMPTSRRYGCTRYVAMLA